MNPLSLLHELILRAFERKWAIISLFLLALCSAICGIILVKTPTFYEYHLRICDRFLNRVCYSDRSVVQIFFERTAGNVLILMLLLAGGVHPAALVLPTTTIAFRAYTFGGTLAILFSVYNMAGALVALTLYLPVHLLIDCIFLLAGSISFSRAFCFRFTSSDFRELLFDFLLLSGLIALICLLEAILLGILFHPIGNIL